ncbi:MAG: hypothetical protein K9M07_06010 [Simkaniaceae bacterium]|nr:hypothetical protein [Simkaniaceae bacterium]MCF7852776.1 hypothetical protein [Simkaniaceae bacterium]
MGYLGCIFSQIFHSAAILKGSIGFIVFVAILFLIDRLIDYISLKKKKS